MQVLEMSLSTTPANVLLEIAEGLPQLQEVLLCYGEMADAAAAAAGWSALPIRSLVGAMRFSKTACVLRIGCMVVALNYLQVVRCLLLLA
jgi:hypothetical protein